MPSSLHQEEDTERAPLLSRNSRDDTATKPPPHKVHPRTVKRLVKRCMALARDLIEFPVKLDDITSPFSPVLTPSALNSFSLLAGDFPSLLPFALLTSRRLFYETAARDPSSTDENEGRALVCETAARWAVEQMDEEEGWKVLSMRFDMEGDDGEVEMPLSALESASDHQATHFLSSPSCQRTIFALWKGQLVQNNIEEKDPDVLGGTKVVGIQYELHRPPKHRSGFLASFNPLRIGVPRYQSLCRIILWIVFLASYQTAIATPQRGMGPEDFVIYIMALGYIAEEATRMWKIGVYPALTYWFFVNLLIYTFMSVALGYRLADMGTIDIDKSDRYRLLSFQWLSCASPLVWCKLVTIFDVHPFFGTLQIVVFRMLRSSSIFFALLTILAVGFLTALSGLDINPDHDVVEGVAHHLMQALLGSPQFGEYEKGTPSYPFGILLYYTWSTLTLVILLNILISLFSSAYAECTQDAVPTFLAFFSAKTLANIRAPDTFVFIAPFNLLEGLIVPLEYIVSKKTYTKINRAVMSVLFFVPICAIALFESRFSSSQTHLPSLRNGDENEGYSPEDLDPEAYVPSPSPSNNEREREIADHRELSKTKYEVIKKGLPDLKRDVMEEILGELRSLRKEVKDLREGKEAKSERE